MNSNNLGNLIISGLNKDNPKIKTKTGFKINYYQTKKSLKNLEEYNSFIKGCERLIRSDDLYKQYKNYILKDLGIDHCMVLSTIKASDNITIEMHHGPLLTLFDCCDIVAKCLILNGEKVNSFRISDIVIKEHYNNIIPVVMLSKTVHELVHSGKIFINLRQAWAWNRINIFLEKYKDGIDDRMRGLLLKNIEASKKHLSTDNNILEVKIKDLNK